MGWWLWWSDEDPWWVPPVAFLGTLLLIGLLIGLAIGSVWFMFGGPTIEGQESTGIIVNVEQSGTFVATWDTFLLHGNSVVAEKTSEQFSLDPGNGTLVSTAQHFAKTGERVTLTFTHHGRGCLWQRMSHKINSCDMVTDIKAAEGTT